ncbi:hypothetical protein NPIL_389651 [Nephila pilipes]|uniref:Uncharacterized protein n=1 Tax=Nephila pilipes TaxID=299642 RepID=A0A8X6IZY0_NEPPI|nr:hypothetical protein NPIL_389651 [Nephila pilipes]
MEDTRIDHKEEQTNLFCENDFFTTWDAHPTIEYNFKSHRKEMSSSDEEIPKCERPSAEYEPHSCEPIDLLIRAPRYVSSHSGEPSISSLPVSEGSPSVRQPVEPSALSDPERRRSHQRMDNLVRNHIPRNKQYNYITKEIALKKVLAHTILIQLMPLTTRLTF